MAERPGVFKRFFTLFLNSLKPRYDRRVVGKDHFNNIYYQEKRLLDDFSKTVNRGYIPSSEGAWKKVPIEWQAWLQNRRSTVPTQEEIDQNFQQMLLVKERASKLDEQANLEKLAQQQSEKAEAGDISPENLSRLPKIKSGYDRGMSSQTVSGEKPAFPKLDDFEIFPGQKYDKNSKAPKK